MESHLGLNPEEMISIFNAMYLDIWERNKEQINWNEEDKAKFFINILEVVVGAARDGAIFTMYENNERIYEQLKELGIEFPDKGFYET